MSVGGIRAGWQGRSSCLLLLTIGSAFLESSLFSKYTYTPTNLHDTMDDEDDDIPLILQVSLHAFIECLSMFQPISGSTGNRLFEVQRNPFHPIRGSLRLVYEGDGQPFLVMFTHS